MPRLPTAERGADCEFAVIIVNWIRGLTANGFFIQRSRCCAHNEWCPPISPNPNSPNPISPNRYTLELGIGLGLGSGLGIGLGMGLGPGFDYFRQYNVIRRIGIRRNEAEPVWQVY